jgi:hypothetical protein
MVASDIVRDLLSRLGSYLSLTGRVDWKGEERKKMWSTSGWLHKLECMIKTLDFIEQVKVGTGVTKWISAVY